MHRPAPAPRLWRLLPLLLSLAATAAAEDREPLPEPLTLQAALALADADHPELALRRSELALAEARREAAAADDDFDTRLRLNARYVDDSNLAVQQQNNDSRAVLLLRKELYDFGRSRDAVQAADAEVAGRDLLLRETRERHRLEIMRAYFNVLLADLDFARADEAMAIAFVDWDRSVDRNALGQVSDIDMLALEDLFQTRRVQRSRAEMHLRAARAALANALNRPEELPATLLPPELTANDSPLPDYERLLARALTGNPRLLALRAQGEAARLRVAERRKGTYPTLQAEANTGYWARDLGNNRESFGASLILDVPLYQGGRVGAQIATEQAQARRVQAEIAALEHELRQAVLEAWQEIQILTTQRDQARVLSDYRDLYLDRSRAEYELELKTDLGDAMVEQSAARLFAARTEFALALAWAELATLVGEPAFDPTAAPADNALSRLAEETPP